MDNYFGKPIIPKMEVRGIAHSVEVGIRPVASANALVTGIYTIRQIPVDLGEFVYRGAVVRVTMTGVLGAPMPAYSLGWGATPNQFAPSASYLAGWLVADSGKVKYHTLPSGTPTEVMPAGSTLNLEVTLAAAGSFTTFTLEAFIFGYYLESL